MLKKVQIHSILQHSSQNLCKLNGEWMGNIQTQIEKSLLENGPIYGLNLAIALIKKGNLQLYQNCRNNSLFWKMAWFVDWISDNNLAEEGWSAII